MNVETIRWGQFRRNWAVFMLLVPTVLGIAIFSYVPAVEAIRHSFYNWDGAFTEEYVGGENFRHLLGDLNLWGPLLLGALFSGLSALVDKPRTRTILRTLGIVGLIGGGIVMFNDARTVFAEGKMTWKALRTVLALLALTLPCILASFKGKADNWRSWARFGAFILPVLAGMTYLISVRKTGDWLLWMSFRLIFIMIIANLFKMWPSIFAAVCIHRLKSDRWQYGYRVLFVIPMIIPQMVGLLIWKFFYDPNVGIFNRVLIGTGLDNVLIWLDKWVLHLGVFTAPFKPAWLGDPSLIIPSLLFWGFPWVGVVGVLIYLAGLQNIGNEVYEAAEIDGIGWWGKFWSIELPLIMTQVRLNLILMVIGTFQAYGFQYILLGAEGGPSNKGLTPGLYMFYQAFQEQNYGYACAVGLILFFIILILTIVNQRYVRVQK
jgi:raffinose/stachyose/melibiose transport system permease protein